MPSEIQYAPLERFVLDAMNPRLSHVENPESLSADQVYDEMRDWSLEELATSFLESGFWPHEAVLCIDEVIHNPNQLVVIEGNRRIAALMRLKKTYRGEETSPWWAQLIQDTAEPDGLFDLVPYIRIDSRSEVDAFLGFRHVTGIKEWAPPAKANFIARLIEEKRLSYRQVMRKIGSKTNTVERNYISFCILRQMEDIDGLDTQTVKRRFSVLFLSLRNRSIQRFLGVDSKFGVSPPEVLPPIDDDHIDNLREYALWLFGDSATAPIVSDSRQVDKFARVLASSEGVNYMRSMKRPNLDTAFVIAGGSREEVLELIRTAAYNLQEALTSIHLFKKDQDLQAVAEQLIRHSRQIEKTLGLSENVESS